MRRLGAIRAAARRGVRTLAGHMEVSGIGLHTGARVRVIARPAAASEGVYFVRTDLGGEPRIAASVASVTDTRLSTTLGDGEGASVRTGVNGDVVGQVASSWVESDPAAAANWVTSLKGTKVYDKELTKKLGGTWARKDPAAALEWAQTLDPKLWVPTSASIVGNLSREELGRNAQWIKESSTDGSNDGVRAAYAMRMADEDPYSAIEQALLMKDALGREKITVHIAKKLYKREPQRIREWLPQSGLSLPSQQRILRNQ